MQNETETARGTWPDLVIAAVVIVCAAVLFLIPSGCARSTAGKIAPGHQQPQ